MRGRSLASACAVVLAAAPVHVDARTPAVPESPTPAVARAPLVVEGDVDAAWRSELEAALVRGLERAGMQTQALPTERSPCDGACWAARARASRHDLVVRARIVAQARLYEVELEARDAETGAVLLGSKQPCQPCGRAEVEAQLETQAAALADSLQRLDRSPAMLAVESRPRGAEILVDGKIVGRAPLEVPLATGSHRVQARLPGHEPRAREVAAVRGVRERWSVTLPAIETVEPVPPRRRDPLWPTGWTLTAVGVPALAVGVTFLALHHRPYRSRCSGDDYDEANDLCRYRWNSLVPGAVLTATGGALAIAGLTMIGVAHRRRTVSRRGVRAGLAPALGPTHAGLVFVGRF